MSMKPQGPNTEAVREQHKAAVREIIRAFNTGDTSLINEIVHPEVQTVETCPGVEANRSGIGQQVEMLRQQFPDAVFEEELLLAEGDLAVLRWKMTGTNTGPIYGRKPTGKFITHHGQEIVRFNSEGQIIEHVDSADILEFMDKLGILDDEMMRFLFDIGVREYPAPDNRPKDF